MIEAAASGAERVVGYEANGGFLIHSNLELHGLVLGALPTRDAVILIVAILLFARLERKTVAELVRALPSRYTASDRLVDFPTEQSQAILSRFDTGDEVRNRHAIESAWGTELGSVKSLDRTDGLRMTFESGEIVHLRASGNAPEFRCYTEASSEARARELNQWCLDRVRRLKVGSREVGGESRLL
jgi:phosphomannomutase